MLTFNFVTSKSQMIAPTRLLACIRINSTCIGYVDFGPSCKAVAYARKRNFQIMTKFCTGVDILHAISCTNFGVDRLRGYGVAGVVFLAPPHLLASSVFAFFYRTMTNCRFHFDRFTFI